MPELWKNSLCNYTWHGGKGWEMDRESSIGIERVCDSERRVREQIRQRINWTKSSTMTHVFTYTRTHCQLSITLTSLWGCALHAEVRRRRWWTERSTSGPDDPNINERLGDICTGALILALTPLFSLTENNQSGVFTASSVFVPSGIGTHLPSSSLLHSISRWPSRGWL